MMDDAESAGLIAHHEAGHAVAMFRLGIAIGRVSIEARDGLHGVCEPATRMGDVWSTSRQEIERFGIALHAGSVAERILRPDDSRTHAGIDHRSLHFLLQVEDDSAVQITWCSYLWQRAYALLVDPWQWKLVAILAATLLEGHSLPGAQVTRLLQTHATALKYDPRMPNAKLLGEPPIQVRSPWHQTWYRGESEVMQPRYEVVLELQRQAQAAAPANSAEAFAALPRRAADALRRAGITRLSDLTLWTDREVRSMKGVGRKTFAEIERAMTAADVRFRVVRGRRKA